MSEYNITYFFQLANNYNIYNFQRVVCTARQPGTGFLDLPGYAQFQIACSVSCINALLLFRCSDLFFVGKTGHPRTTSLVPLVVGGW